MAASSSANAADAELAARTSAWSKHLTKDVLALEDGQQLNETKVWRERFALTRPQN